MAVSSPFTSMYAALFAFQGMVFPGRDMCGFFAFSGLFGLRRAACAPLFLRFRRLRGQPSPAHAPHSVNRRLSPPLPAPPIRLRYAQRGGPSVCAGLPVCSRSALRNVPGQLPVPPPPPLEVSLASCQSTLWSASWARPVWDRSASTFAAVDSIVPPFRARVFARTAMPWLE